MSENDISVINEIDCYASGFGFLLEFVSLARSQTHTHTHQHNHRYSNTSLLIHLLGLTRWLSSQFPAC